MADDAPRPITHADLCGLAGLQRRGARGVPRGASTAAVVRWARVARGLRAGRAANV